MRKISLQRSRTANHGVRILRDINEVIVLNIIREQQPVSRMAIADLAGLEPGTVSRILSRFEASDLISEAGSGPSTPNGGRKPRYVTLNPAKHCAIGMDIGARETTLGFSDFNGEIHDLRRIPNSRDAESTLIAAAEEIRSLIALSAAYDRFGGVGVGLIGLVDCAEGIIWEGENLGWPPPVEVGCILRGLLPDVPFYFENAARLSALAEVWFGTSRLSGVRNLVFLQVDEGVGSGIILDGQLYKGHANGAGEFGHISIDPRGPECSCGSRGCLEAFASDLATVARYQQVRGETNGGAVEMTAVVQRALGGEPAAVKAIRQTARYLGYGLAAIVYSLSPELIVVGGQIAKVWPLIQNEIREACGERVSAQFLQNLHLVPSTMKVNSSVMGAVSLVLAQNFATAEIHATG